MDSTRNSTSTARQGDHIKISDVTPETRIKINGRDYYVRVRGLSGLVSNQQEDVKRLVKQFFESNRDCADLLANTHNSLSFSHKISGMDENDIPILDPSAVTQIQKDTIEVGNATTQSQAKQLLQNLINTWDPSLGGDEQSDGSGGTAAIDSSDRDDDSDNDSDGGHLHDSRRGSSGPQPFRSPQLHRRRHRRQGGRDRLQSSAPGGHRRNASDPGQMHHSVHPVENIRLSPSLGRANQFNSAIVEEQEEQTALLDNGQGVNQGRQVEQEVEQQDDHTLPTSPIPSRRASTPSSNEQKRSSSVHPSALRGAVQRGDEEEEQEYDALSDTTTNLTEGLSLLGGSLSFDVSPFSVGDW